MSEKLSLIIASLLFSLALIATGFLVQNGLTNLRTGDRTVTVKGLAQKDVESNLAIWTLAYTETGNDLPALQDRMEGHGQRIQNFLARYGFEESEISLQQVNVQDRLAQAYRQGGSSEYRYILTYSYLLRSGKTRAVENAARNVGTLIRDGIVFANSGSNAPTYLFTRLNDVKPEMIARATQNARKAAAEFATNSGQKVGRIKSASQGVFQILPRDQTYAVPEAQQMNKTVRVVSTVEYYLDD